MRRVRWLISPNHQPYKRSRSVYRLECYNAKLFERKSNPSPWIADPGRDAGKRGKASHRVTAVRLRFESTFMCEPRSFPSPGALRDANQYWLFIWSTCVKLPKRGRVRFLWTIDASPLQPGNERKQIRPCDSADGMRISSQVISHATLKQMRRIPSDNDHLRASDAP